tara:strand:- start:20755 stop:22014 length:1260 start_codon:yes stop_codon:yes gene_type:complete
MKNRQAISLLFLSNIISGFAQGISMIAIPWYFVDQIGKPLLFANFYLLITFLTLFWGLYAGTIIDRYSRKKVFIYTNLICGLIILTISFYGYVSPYGVPSFLVLLVFGLTIFNYNIHYPNLYAFGQEITEEKSYGKLNSYIEIQGQVTSMLAGAVAAILLSGVEKGPFKLGGFMLEIPFSIEKWSIQKVFMLDAVTYFLSAFIFLFIKYIPIVTDKIDKGRIIQRLKSGFNFLRDNRQIFIFGVFTYMLFAFTIVQVHILLPSYVENFMREDASVYASAEMYYSLGAILSGILVYRILKKYNAYLSIVFLMSIVSVSFFFMTFINSLFIFFIANFILGITNAGVRILRTTYLFSKVPNNIIGRAGSVFGSINVTIRMILIGILSLPFFMEGYNIRWSYFIGGVLMVFTISVLLYYSSKE